MSSISEFGILPPRSAKEPRYQDRTTISHQDFCKRAGELLFKLTEPVVGDSIPNLENYPAKWQPMGFQIYDLGIYPELGFLRLHVWPANLRRATQKTNIIHSHPRHLASTIMYGVYRDSIFSVSQDDDSKNDGQAKKYTLYGKSISADQTEALSSQNIEVEASLKASRIIPVGSQHFIEPGVFHQTEIPLGETCVTLAFNSFRTSADGPFMLLDEQPNVSSQLRESVTLEELNSVKKLFLDKTP